VAERYAADELTRKPWDVERLRRFAVDCPPGPVLDVGCGPAGHVGRFVADLGARVVGVDFSERSVALAQRLNPSLRFVVADMQTLPFVTGACAGIVAFYSMIYAADPQPVLRELRRVLRRGAPLLIAVHGGEGAQHFDDYKGMAIDVDIHFRSSDVLASQVRAAGFAIETVEVRPPYPFEHATPRVYVAAR
jgi:SAM-dependent methyltransferase